MGWARKTKTCRHSYQCVRVVIQSRNHKTWQSGFLPGIYQGTYIDTKNTNIEKLIANVRNSRISPNQQERQLNLLRLLNSKHLDGRDGDAQLESRIQSFELAFRMQTEAADAFDIDREPKHIREMYGEGVQARQILIARRLVERGVRFVQLWHGAGQPWDNHDDIEINHRRLAQQCDKAIGALIKDLKQRGAAGRNSNHLWRRIWTNSGCRAAS